MTQINVLNQIQ